MEDSVFQFLRMEDVEHHKSTEDCYVVVDSVVYDISNVVKTDSIVNSKDCGKDVSGKVSRTKFLEKYDTSKIGSVIVSQDSSFISKEKEKTSETLIPNFNDDVLSVTNILSASAVLVLVVAIVVFLVVKFKK